MMIGGIRFILKAGKNKDLPGKKSMPNQAIKGGICGRYKHDVMEETKPSLLRTINRA